MNYNYRATKLANSRCELPLIIIISVDVVTSMMMNILVSQNFKLYYIVEYNIQYNCISVPKLSKTQKNIN